MSQGINTPLANVLPQVIEHAVERYTFANDPFYAAFFKRTSEGVVQGAGSIGRDWKVLRPLRVGVAGAVKFREIHDSGELESNAGLQWVPRQVKTFPTLDEISLVGFENLELQIIECYGNFAFPVSLLAANNLPATVIDVIGENVMGVSENYSLCDIQALYSASATTKQLGTVSGSGTFTYGSPVAASAGVITVTGGRISNFRAGMWLDFYDSTGVTKRNTTFKVVVGAVDRISKQLLVADPTGQNSLAAIASTDLIVRRDSFGKMPQGFADWHKATGSVLGVPVDITTANSVPDLRSFVSTTGGILTETVLNQLVADFDDAYPGRQLAGAATSAMINKHLADLVTFDGTTSTSDLGMMQFQRQGAPVERVTGFKGAPETGGTGFVHAYRGKRIPIYASAYQRSGVLNIEDVGEGNCKRYSPPRVGGMGSHASFGGEIQFLFGYDKGGSIFGNAPTTVPGSTSVAPSDYFWAPFYGFYNRMSVRPQGIVSSGHTEDTSMSYS